MLENSVGRLRVLAFLEGMSYLLLLFIAMPLKYWFGFPLAVTIIGGLHGLLFVVLLLALAQVFFTNKTSFWVCLLGVVASLIPFGTFFYDRTLRKIEEPIVVVKKEHVL